MVASPGTRSRVLQPLGITYPVKWSKTTSVTTSTSGASGVFFFHEGAEYDQNSTIVVKAETSPPVHHAIAGSVLDLMGVGKAPEIREMSLDEVKKARKLIAKKCDWQGAAAKKAQETADSLRKKRLAAFDRGPYWMVMRLAPGNSHSGFAESSEASALVKRLEDEFWGKIGAMAVVDIFLENNDRLITVNHGNWMLGPKGEVIPIDNINDFQLNENDIIKGAYGEAAWKRNAWQWFGKINPEEIDRTAPMIVDNVWKATKESWKKGHPGDDALEKQAPNLTGWKLIVAQAMKDTRKSLLSELTSTKTQKGLRTQYPDNKHLERIIDNAERESFGDRLTNPGGLSTGMLTKSTGSLGFGGI
jgi:hypothetical protein